MEICSARTDVWREYDKLLSEVLMILEDRNLLISDDWNIFEVRKGLTFDEISRRLKEKQIEFQEEDLLYVLYFMLSNDKRIVRDDYWSKESEYRFLDRKLWKSSAQKYHYSYVDDSMTPKTFLLISDTHIGKLFNSKLLHNLYDYAISYGATVCYHLADLFHGLPALREEEYKYGSPQQLILDNKEEFDRQINNFINEYPKPSPNELRTYCLMGNHDETMNRYMMYQSWVTSCDLRKLTIYNPSLYMFPRDAWVAKLNNIGFHFNHRLYMSAIIRDLKITNLDDIAKKEEMFGDLMLDSHYDVLVSGHMHKPFVYTNPNYYKEKDNLYLGVPSTSSVNIGGVVGYLIYMYPESNSMEVSVLGCDNNLNIYEKDRISWGFNKHNKVYRKTF